MPAQHASHVPGGYAYTASAQPSTGHASANPSVYDASPLPIAPPISINSARSDQTGMSLGYHNEPLDGYTSRAMSTQNHSSFARHFQQYDQLSLTENYGPSTFGENTAQQPNHAAQSALTFPQTAATTHYPSHEPQPTFLNEPMAPSGTGMPSSSEHLDPITMRALMHASPSHTTASKRSREDPLLQSDSVKRTRLSVDGARPADSGLSYSDHAWEMSDFSMSSQQSRALPRPPSGLSGMNSPFRPDSRVASSHNSGPVIQRFLASPASDRPHSADSQSRSPAETLAMNALVHGPTPGSSSSLRAFASPRRRFSSASSHTFPPPTSISDSSTSQSPTIPCHPAPDGVNPYYTPPSSSGLRASASTNSAASFASSSTLSAPGGTDALVTTNSDDGSSNVSHSLGETEMIASFPQFYERARALCLKFNNDAANLLRATPQDVLAQSFQMGMGADPMKMLNDAKSICERMMLADFTLRDRANSSHLENTMPHGLPSSYSTSAYPPSFHSQWSPRPASSSYPTVPSGVDEYFAHDQLPKGFYGPDPTIQREATLSRTPSSIDVSFNNSTLRSAANVNHGTWRDEESEKLKQLAEHSRVTSKAAGQDKVDWDWVVERFGASRTRHQILIKATHLGLKPTSTHPSRIRKRLAKAEAQAAAAAAANTPSSSDSSGPPAALLTSLAYQESMTSPTTTPRHYPPHVLNQTIDGRPNSGESSHSVTGLTFESGGSA
ncbi:hypothetical protein FRC09_001371 [Ceratobasidium sp. 395]|nr:hypothetical protein FRC09_001371 [Ceratobasidium sp. 395]